MTKSITLNIRKKVVEIQQNRCIYCGKPFSEYKPTNHHRDHNQHNNYEDNIIISCENCHRKMNTVETIFANASDFLRQEIVYSILRVAPPSLVIELSGLEYDHISGTHPKPHFIGRKPTR